MVFDSDHVNQSLLPQLNFAFWVTFHIKLTNPPTFQIQKRFWANNLKMTDESEQPASSQQSITPITNDDDRGSTKNQTTGRFWSILWKIYQHGVHMCLNSSIIGRKGNWNVKKKIAVQSLQQNTYHLKWNVKHKSPFLIRTSLRWHFQAIWRSVGHWASSRKTEINDRFSTH